MNFRQVHLDFHTSEKIAGIGSRFSKEQFQDALRRGHVNSITLFSKCHHGWAYHPTKANERHPGLDFDLLGAEIEAAHEIGVKTPVYISAGLDEKLARRHPEWLMRGRDESLNWARDFTQPGYHQFCLNTPYLDILLAQIAEVVQNYDADGIFLDIVGVRRCWCQNCIRTLIAEGKDPYDEANITALGERTYANYTRRVRETIDRYKPGLPVFHNGGHIRRGRRDLAFMDTHLELESLPTGGWGYDHFPMSAAYVRTLGLEYLGMTGKFHTSWGEFGGFKHPNALRYEAALSAAFGAKCSIGDQMHPLGFLDPATYDLIGAAYGELEQKEPWLDGARPVTDVAILSQEAVANYFHEPEGARNGTRGDIGAVRVMLEGKYLFNIVDTEAPLDGYRLVILPDTIRPDAALEEKLAAYVRGGGRLLATGVSGLRRGEDVFAFDLGARYVGPSAYRPVYFRPGFPIAEWPETSFVIYAPAQDVEATGECLAVRENPYFNRTVEHFCSHKHAPNDPSAQYPAVTVGPDGAYVSAALFEEYAACGSLIAKRILTHVIDTLLGEEKTLSTDLPAQGIATLMEQSAQDRLVTHLLYVSPVRRGEGIEVIEDVIPLYDVHAALRLPRAPRRVYLAPSGEELPFAWENGKLTFTVPKLTIHAMAVVQF